MKKLFILFFLVPTIAFGVVPEIPANGWDDGASSGTAGACPTGYMDASFDSGCDLMLTGDDKDYDGYNSDQDCDDEDKRIFAGISTTKGCSGGEYRTCQAGGSFTSCGSATLAESATNNYYIDCDSGSDGNSGTFASPFATLGKVSGGSGATGLPSSPVTLSAGDHVYISGTCTTTISYGATPTLFASGASGSSGSGRIVIKGYPGGAGKLQTSDAVAAVLTHDYYKFESLEFATARSSTSNGAGILGYGSDNLEVVNVYFSQMTGHGDNNDSAIFLTGTNSSLIHNSFFKNCIANTGNVDNISCIKWLDNEGEGTGLDHYAHHIFAYFSSFSDSDRGDVFRQKHGIGGSSAGSNGHRIENAIAVNARRMLAWDSSHLRATNLFQYVDGGTGQGFNLRWSGEPGHEQIDNQITSSTFYNVSKNGWSLPRYDGTEGLTLSDLIIVDNSSSYPTNEDGLITIDPYGTDAQKTTFESSSYLTASGNCYYNASTAAKFNYFAIDDVGAGDEAGGLYTLANWKTATSEDSTSVEENPSLTSFFQGGSVNCTGKGWVVSLSPSGGSSGTNNGGLSLWY